MPSTVPTCGPYVGTDDPRLCGHLGARRAWVRGGWWGRQVTLRGGDAQPGLWAGAPPCVACLCGPGFLARGGPRLLGFLAWWPVPEGARNWLEVGLCGLPQPSPRYRMQSFSPRLLVKVVTSLPGFGGRGLRAPLFLLMSTYEKFFSSFFFFFF